MHVLFLWTGSTTAAMFANQEYQRAIAVMARISDISMPSTKAAIILAAVVPVVAIWFVAVLKICSKDLAVVGQNW